MDSPFPENRPPNKSPRSNEGYTLNVAQQADRSMPHHRGWAASLMSLDFRSCRVCAGTLLEGRRTREGGHYNRCADCGSEHRKLDADDSGRTSFESSQEKYHRGSAIFDVPLIGKIGARLGAERAEVFAHWVPGGSKILEVGPGAGFFLAALKEMDYYAEAVEESRDFAQAIVDRLAIPVHVGVFEDDSFDQSYAGVASFHVIEHVAEPLKHLEKLASVTAVGGHLLLATPNARGFQHRLLRRLSPTYSEAHLVLLTPSGIKTALQFSGWQVVVLTTTEGPEDMLRGVSAIVKALTHRPAGFAMARSLNETSSDRLIRLFGIASMPFRRLLARAGLGNELMVVARRVDLHEASAA